MMEWPSIPNTLAIHRHLFHTRLGPCRPQTVGVTAFVARQQQTPPKQVATALCTVEMPTVCLVRSMLDTRMYEANMACRATQKHQVNPSRPVAARCCGRGAILSTVFGRVAAAAAAATGIHTMHSAAQQQHMHVMPAGSGFGTSYCEQHTHSQQPVTRPLTIGQIHKPSALLSSAL